MMATIATMYEPTIDTTATVNHGWSPAQFKIAIFLFLLKLEGYRLSNRSAQQAADNDQCCFLESIFSRTGRRAKGPNAVKIVVSREPRDTHLRHSD
jgi:hypothetical protein